MTQMRRLEVISQKSFSEILSLHLLVVFKMHDVLRVNK